MTQQKFCAYLPNGECWECTEIADLCKLNEVVQRLSDVLLDGKEQLLEAWERISKMKFEIWTRGKSRINFNPPDRWKLAQDKRRNTSPLGRSTYLYKARKIKSLARSTHPRCAPHRGAVKDGVKQCKHTFEITRKRCAPCSGYDTKCDHYKSDAADTKHHSTP